MKILNYNVLKEYKDVFIEIKHEYKTKNKIFNFLTLKYDDKSFDPKNL